MPDEPLATLSSPLEVTRREALKLFGVGVAALQAACMQRAGEEIRPAVRMPERAPGAPTMFATSMVVDGYATGLLALAYDGRPTKLEGNPAHPASLGATSAQHQAAILDLYDPHRLRAPQAAGMPATWARFATDLAHIDGELWLIVPPDGGAAIEAQLARVRAQHPRVHVVHHTVVGREAYRGTMLAFGAPLALQLALDRADVVVALDADVLSGMPMSLRWAHDFATRRRTVEPGERPARLFVAEPMLTPTGTMADRRAAVRASEVAALTVALVDAVGKRGVAGIDLPQHVRDAARARVGDPRWIDAAAEALVRHPRASAIVAGDRQPAAVHALAHRLSIALGNAGTTTWWTAPSVSAPLGEARLDELAAAIDAGRVGAVIAIETDPVHDAPGELALAARLTRVPLTAHVALHPGATSAACRWVLPCAHFLESWGDARAWDGTRSTIQPLIQPLHDTRSRLQLLAMLAGDAQPDERALVRGALADRIADDAAWHAALANGVIDTPEAPVAVRPRGGTELADALAALLVPDDSALEVALAPSPSIGDGRFANNPWLQELPHPLTKLTWGNAALMSAATAQRLGVTDGQVVEVVRDAARVAVPALVAPGHADGCITIELGYGHDADAAPIARGIGGNAAPLGGPIVRDAEVRVTSRRIAIARTQLEFHRHDREVAYQVELADYRAHPQQFEEHRGNLPSMLAERAPSEALQWAMTIDTTICTGCSACMIACQAENNVPVVGAEGVRRGREMHWIRIDNYIDDTPRGPEVVHQPMLCQHCEHAPCEYVCPVFATTHSPDGLNEMTYNRCIGTRFCSNNCPYKVRRFNWFAYDLPTTTAALQRNPNVTVRERGVMEKCTYCVQRIRGAEIHARMDGREIAPGEVMTACQQACPTRAIQFGALQHADSDMVRWRASGRTYATLHEVGTRPRTLYLAKVRDPDGENR